MVTSPQKLRLCCPRCRQALEEIAEGLRCPGCSRVYPAVLGIPDLRIAPDPWIGIEADRAKGQQLERETADLDFEAMVGAYWAMTPETPAKQALRFISHVKTAEARSAEWLATLQPPIKPGERWLDLGCGTADIAAAAGAGVETVSLDVAFRWLVVARRRLKERRVPSQLICGNAEALPFPDRSFDRVLMLGTLEHCPELEPVLSEAGRVLRAGGLLHLRSANRFSALPEPHVGLFGVGWLPRAWADPYVRWRTGGRYQQHWLRGAMELRRALRRADFRGVRVEAAALLKAESDRLPALLRRAGPTYAWLRRTPGFRWVCRRVAPLLEASGQAS